MSRGRRSSRRQAAFILYQADLLKLGVESALARAEECEVSDYTRRLVMGVGAARSRIDSTIGRHLTGWTLERLGVLERAVLRVATQELLTQTEVPVAVVIDEAVDLAKRFCSGEAAALVNGVLAGVAVEVRGPEGRERRSSEDGV